MADTSSIRMLAINKSVRFYFKNTRIAAKTNLILVKAYYESQGFVKYDRARVRRRCMETLALTSLSERKLISRPYRSLRPPMDINRRQCTCETRTVTSTIFKIRFGWRSTTWSKTLCSWRTITPRDGWTQRYPSGRWYPCAGNQANRTRLTKWIEDYFFCSVLEDDTNNLPATPIALAHKTTKKINEPKTVTRFIYEESRNVFWKNGCHIRSHDRLAILHRPIQFPYLQSIYRWSTLEVRVKVVSNESSTPSSLSRPLQSSWTVMYLRHATPKYYWPYMATKDVYELVSNCA